MKRLLWLACGIMLLIGPHSAWAQRRGGRGRGGGRSSTGGAPATDDTKGLRHALAVQATPDQVDQFDRMTKSVEAAHKQARELLALAERTTADRATNTELFQHVEQLTSAVEDAETDNQGFVKSFFPEQKAGLKDLSKKLEKASSEVAKRNKAPTQVAGHPGAKQLGGVAEELDKALAELEAKQRAMGDEMGIPGAANQK